MKVTVELSKQELQGIADYLFDLNFERPTKEEIQQYIRNIVDATIHCPKEAVSDYINNAMK